MSVRELFSYIATLSDLPLVSVYAKLVLLSLFLASQCMLGIGLQSNCLLQNLVGIFFPFSMNQYRKHLLTAYLTSCFS